MARFLLHLPIAYCAIVLLISAASTDLQQPNSVPSPTAKPKCNCDLDNLPVPQAGESSLQPSEVMNNGDQVNALRVNSTRNSSATGSPKPLLESFNNFAPLNLPSHASNEKPEFSNTHTHSSPPANSFKSYSSAQLFGEVDESQLGPALAEARSGLSGGIRPILRSEDILQLGNIMEPFKGPRRRRRRRRRTPLVTDPGNKVHYVYPHQSSDVLNQNKVPSIDTSMTSRIPLRNLGNHRAPLITSSDTEGQRDLYRQPTENSPQAPGFHENHNFLHWNNTANLQIPNHGTIHSANENVGTQPIIDKNFERHVPTPTFIMMPRVGNDPELPDMVVWSRNTEQYNKREVQTMLQKAMANAWAEYGPGSKPPSQYQYISVQPQNHISNRQAPILLSPNFQPVTSEWDKDMTKTPNRHEVLEPGLFNRILSTYIDFEVNNHELADLLRKIFFGFVIGLIIVGWVLLGLWIGFLPYKLMLLTKRDVEGKGYDEYMDANQATSRNTIIKDLTQSVYLALEGNWLKKLEEIVSKNSDSKWLKTNVHCCILPDASTTGMAECQVIRKARKDSTFKCLSDLIYNFQFGPSDQPSSQ